MPRTSQKDEVLNRLRVSIARKQRLRELLERINGDEYNTSSLVIMELLQRRQYMNLKSFRYIKETRETYRDGIQLAYDCFERDLEECDSPWLNDTEFTCKYCMSKASFWKLHALIESH